jgi:histidine triad (HIT) family protein
MLAALTCDLLSLISENAMTIFEKIIAREIPAKIIWEDDEVIAFHDVNPQAPVHVLIVPKKVIPRLTAPTEANRTILGKLLLVAGDLAKKLGVEKSGYRIVINSGPDAGESVPHLHVHLLGKRALAWPPG